MADNKLELVVSVEVDKANQSIKSVNASLSGMEQSAVKAARGASGGIDHMTASMVKGATAGQLLAMLSKKRSSGPGSGPSKLPNPRSAATSMWRSDRRRSWM